MKHPIRSGLALAAVFTLGACGTASQDSTGLITNGATVAAGEYPSVVLLYDAKMGGMCTGTFINETTVLTAAHCSMSGKVDANGNVNGTLYLMDRVNVATGEAVALAASTSVKRNPLWDRNGGNVNRYDLGLVTFPAGFAKAISPIAPAAPRAGASLTIVGFGLNQSKNLYDGSSAGVKRVGVNTIKSVSKGFIEFTGQATTTNANGSNASASTGDSGGPLFVDGQLAGVTSGGGAGWFSSNSTSASAC